MKIPKNLVTLVALIMMLHLVFPQRTYAYIDPGSGSYFLQILVAGLLGLLYSIKLFWARIRVSLSKWAPASKISKYFKW
jgi:hypothetical protein